ncbi:MAG: TIGR02466 family protein [Pseudomonadota bacterium]
MATVSSLFATPLYRARLSDHGAVDGAELQASCLSIAEDDEAGQTWCEREGFPGYTSYASLTDLPWRFPVFETVKQSLDAHVAAFAKALAFDLGDKALVLEDLWINILPEGGIHTGHIHPHSVISGTTYVAMPAGTSAIKFEDPRLAMMMAAPPRRADAPEGMQSFVYVAPEVGDVLLWESWLRHEVPMNMAEDDRISVSFNYKWAECPSP